MPGHKKRVDDVLQKGRELLEVSSSLRRKKVELKEKLLSRLLELQKALEEVSDLQEKIDSPSSRSFLFESGSTGVVLRSWHSSVSFEKFGVVWRVVTRMWRI